MEIFYIEVAMVVTYEYRNLHLKWVYEAHFLQKINTKLVSSGFKAIIFLNWKANKIILFL